MLIAEIEVTLKKTVLDPQGLTIKHALESLGYKGISDVRIGKFLTIRLDYNNKNKAEKQIQKMCKVLLANPIIENYHFNIKEG